MMSGRKIYCVGCNEYLGVIRDAKLRKGIVFLCKNCGTKRVALEMQRETRPSVDMGDLFGGVFRK